MLRFLAYSFISLFISNSAYAADLAILPVGLSLASSNTKGMITVSNRAKESIVVQAEAVSWTQADGKDEYAPTRELLINPPLFTIQQGRSQVLRVGLRQAPNAKQETAYRLLLREVPPALPTNAQVNEGKQGNVRVLLQVRLPIYISPTTPIRLEQWQAQRNADGSIALKINNTGNVHTLVNELKLRSADAAADSTPVATAKAGNVVFPGQSYSWNLKPQAKLQQKDFILEVKTDRGQQNVPLDLGPP